MAKTFKYTYTKQNRDTLISTVTVPVHAGTLGVHQVELVTHAAQHLGNGSRVADHLHFGEVAALHHRGQLVVDADFEASRGSVHEANGALRLDRADRRIHVLEHHVTAVVWPSVSSSWSSIHGYLLGPL